MTAVIDYGVGNLFSLTGSLREIGCETEIVSDVGGIERADRIILPGVGAFCDAAEKLKNSGMQEALLDAARSGKPFLGICLGMQLLFEKSFENGEYDGLGLIKGSVKRIPCGLKIPHIGWNRLHIVKDSPILKYTSENDYVYFVHSYCAVDCGENVVATTDYGVEVTASVQSGNVFGCQFHPEKSGNVGLNILRAFCEIQEKK